LLLLVPNVPSKETPVGKDSSQNVPWSYWSPTTGQIEPKDPKVADVPTKFNFEPKDHITLGKELDLIDKDRGVITSGFRGYYLKNEAVLLQYALLWHAIAKLREKGFTLMVPPVLVREFSLVGSGHFPLGKDEIYQISNAGDMNEGDTSKEPLYLAGTSEPSLLAYYADTILEEKDLPLKLSGISPCYRSEVGSYGKDAHGIYRIHEFMKVEQVILCKADENEADSWHEKLRETAEEILQELKLPYRVLNICTGDMGAGKYKMYDIETWMPSRQDYGETHSDSNLTDWQARRLNIRYRDTAGKIHYVYTLNNTAVASPRILIPILENYQQADGSVMVPEVLRKYVGMDVIKKNN
jgi:seryl-tRNA synthetase